MTYDSQLLYAGIGAIICIFWIILLQSWNVMSIFKDIPNSRSSHSKVIPRGAGFSFAITVVSVSAYLNSYLYSSLVALSVAALGLYDDAKALSAKTRFIIQIILCLLAFQPFLSNLNIPAFFIFFLAIGLLIVFLTSINFYNFADGINGHIAIQAIINIFAWMILTADGGTWRSVGSDPIIWGVLGSLVLFLWANVYKGWVFMGDAGSTFLGFFLTLLPINHLILENLSLRNSVQTVLAYFFFSFIIFADCTTLIVAKIYYRIPVSLAHRHHFYQQLSRKSGWTHFRVSLFLAAWQIGISTCFLASKDIHWGWLCGGIILTFSYLACTIQTSIFAAMDLKKKR